ncbi:polysaccharide pyruvyl transferase family protein [Clostridium saccharoperbutylacetonicum]|uniref:polysaccharide pyruvyl transferase family protein n=1 Tax=Clostridium saccharoperbutylacetonicum TaxID=36745 RepID=UPI000983BBE2|nr:polysaccharide pyruvyl transferase family protein [Clostridium saccharoperbutylacetonicum]AQR95081.1 polysaccharide pyruvyl transferase [Clostridium saccharoperbutylacetonicum]NSB30928.1 hypothetical protein [Clostridium saccharoperbutylacetonicum]
MKKVAIVSCYFMKNYGSMLQAYATQKILDNFGVENETICIKGLDKEIKYRKMKYFASKVLDIDTVRNKWSFIKHSIYKIINLCGFKDKMKKRSAAFEKFLPLFHISREYASFDQLKNAVSSYSSVIVGSDQLWLPSNISADYYTLNWVPYEINKISYATSFGVAHLETRFQNLAKSFLARINYLSVRELSGKKLIKEITGIDAKIVCDPTLLFTADEWMDIQPIERLIKKPYIFCYFIGNNREQRQFVNKLKIVTGYKIVALLHIDEFIRYDEAFVDEAPYHITPGDFINLIRNAEYVCTDSFHGSVFSILNKKKFFTFKRFKANRKGSTNSRLDSLFNLLGLEERMLSPNDDVEHCIHMKIDYETVHKKLNSFREESKKYLREALGI